MGSPQIAAEEEEAVKKLRAALRNPHGTSTENRERVFSAWQSLRSVATSPDVQSRSRKRRRKKSRLEDKAQKKKKENGDETKIDGGHANSSSAKLMREEDKMLHETARLGQADRVRELISQGSKVSAKDNSGYSALHWASLYGHVEVVRTLLGLGAGDGKRINHQNDAGNTALHLACLGHHAQVAAMLRIYKPDEYLMNAYDQTPISLGLRDLVDSVEKIQHLEHLQTQRATTQKHHLLSESLDWRMRRDSEFGTDNIARANGTGSEALGALQGDWDDYNRAYTEFVERFVSRPGTDYGTVSSRDPPTKSAGLGTVPAGAIRFHDVPWPVTRTDVQNGGHVPSDKSLGNERLLLAELGLTGAALRALIQRERLRWHPDKVLQLFGRHLFSEDKMVIMAGVQTVCQLLNSLADATEEAGE
ncbi:unnamed protein product [Calypogeia fissa]